MSGKQKPKFEKGSLIEIVDNVEKRVKRECLPLKLVFENIYEELSAIIEKEKKAIVKFNTLDSDLFSDESKKLFLILAAGKKSDSPVNVLLSGGFVNGFEHSRMAGTITPNQRISLEKLSLLINSCGCFYFKINLWGSELTSGEYYTNINSKGKAHCSVFFKDSKSNGYNSFQRRLIQNALTDTAPASSKNIILETLLNAQVFLYPALNKYTKYVDNLIEKMMSLKKTNRTVSTIYFTENISFGLPVDSIVPESFEESLKSIKRSFNNAIYQVLKTEEFFKFRYTPDFYEMFNALSMHGLVDANSKNVFHESELTAEIRRSPPVKIPYELGLLEKN